MSSVVPFADTRPTVFCGSGKTFANINIKTVWQTPSEPALQTPPYFTLSRIHAHLTTAVPHVFSKPNKPNQCLRLRSYLLLRSYRHIENRQVVYS
jgi:hypothetical protein